MADRWDPGLQQTPRLWATRQEQLRNGDAPTGPQAGPTVSFTVLHWVSAGRMLPRSRALAFTATGEGHHQCGPSQPGSKEPGTEREFATELTNQTPGYRCSVQQHDHLTERFIYTNPCLGGSLKHRGSLIFPESLTRFQALHHDFMCKSSKGTSRSVIAPNLETRKVGFEGVTHPSPPRPSLPPCFAFTNHYFKLKLLC